MQTFDWKVADVTEYDLLKENAKNNRQNQTEAESFFWQIACCNGLGEKCRRQYVIGDYIVDFIFRKSMLIVELDGGYHRPDGDLLAPLKGELRLTGDMLTDFAKDDKSWINDPEQIQRDKERQDWLERMGYKILRFTNEQVLFDTDNVINIIKQNLSL